MFGMYKCEETRQSLVSGDPCIDTQVLALGEAALNRT
jgi:hypothetical protein